MLSICVRHHEISRCRKGRSSAGCKHISQHTDFLSASIFFSILFSTFCTGAARHIINSTLVFHFHSYQVAVRLHNVTGETEGTLGDRHCENIPGCITYTDGWVECFSAHHENLARFHNCTCTCLRKPFLTVHMYCSCDIH